MTNDKHIKDGLTVNDIYRSFERRKRQRKAKFKKLFPVKDKKWYHFYKIN
jgi:hypothetical protein